MPGLNRKYPHLHPDDIQIWLRFIDGYEKQFDRFDYDVNVGDGRDPGPHYDKFLRKMAVGLSQRRIDVVAHTKNNIICIELTPSLGWRAIGQCLGYPLLYRTAYNPNKTVLGLIVCETIQTDLKPCCQHLELPVLVLGKPGDPNPPWTMNAAIRTAI